MNTPASTPTDSKPPMHLVIVGGGTAGWMSAALLSRVLEGRARISLVESEEIGTVGVGEATIPAIRLFNQAVGVDENEFLRATQGTFKLGIEFVDWGALGQRYMHAFGRIGQDRGVLDFHHHWVRLRRAGLAAPLERYSINRMASLQGKFMRATNEVPNSPLAEITHAFHFDASLYARYLRGHAEQRGVRRIEGRIDEVLLHEEPGARDGHVRGLRLADGQLIDGDFFLDCSGFRGLLIEQALHVGYEDWSHLLPADRAIAVPCASAGPLTPYTRATARSAGWQWRIPLQHRIGNGHVHCSKFISEDEATAVLLANLDGERLAEPRTLRFVTGKRRKFWHRNVLAVGLASGFLEPLESTSIHLVQSTLARFVNYFPDGQLDQVLIDEYNAQADAEMISIRDFIVLHYHATARQDTPFWRYCRRLEVPATLRRKLALWRTRGQVVRDPYDLFSEAAWVQVMEGQLGLPARHHPLAETLPMAEAARFADEVAGVIGRCVEAMPTHEAFIERHCRAGG